MNFFRKFFALKLKTGTDLSVNAGEKSISDDELVNDCKKFLATGALSNKLKEKITHYKQQDSSISEYEAVEMILDHCERLTK